MGPHSTGKCGLQKLEEKSYNKATTQQIYTHALQAKAECWGDDGSLLAEQKAEGCPLRKLIQETRASGFQRQSSSSSGAELESRFRFPGGLLKHLEEGKGRAALIGPQQSFLLAKA